MNILVITDADEIFSISASLGQGASMTVIMAINFNDTTQPAKFDICTQEQKFPVNITAPVGELLQPHTMGEKEFNEQQGQYYYII